MFSESTNLIEGVPQKESVMIIKSSYDSAEGVPQEFKDSFKEVEGKFVFSGSIDVKTQEDVDKVLGAKKHIDTELSEVKELLKAEKQGKLEIQSKLEVVELQLKDGADPAKLQELVETKVKVATEQLTTQLAERDEQITGFQNTIHGNEKNEFINGFKSEFSETVGKEISLIGGNLFERQADNSYLTVENKTLGIEAGLNREQAVAKLNVSMPSWQKQTGSDHAHGANGAPMDNRAKFNDLLKKQQGGETLNRQESIELSTLANEMKNNGE